MVFVVHFTDAAAQDLEDIYDYIALHDSHAKADALLEQFNKALGSLSEFPERGSYPKELSALGIKEFRQVFFKPYRLIYRTIEQRVYVLLIVDGRRDMQTLLQQRLLQA